MTHNWKIYDLKRTITDGIVTEIIYACESELSGSTTRKIGELTITGSTDDTDFIEYENLTEDIVLGWVTDSIDTSTFETANSSSIAEKIARKAARTTTNGTPW